MMSAPQEIAIRQAHLPDASEWLRLRALLWPDVDPAQERQYVTNFLAGENPALEIVFLAVDQDDHPVGFAEISLRPYVPDASTIPAPFLEGWFVEPPFRGTGLGRRLIDAASHWATNHGYRELGSDAALENVDAAAAHAALGFREVERVRFFIRDLNGAR